MTTEYPDNSHKAKDAQSDEPDANKPIVKKEKKIEALVTTKVTRRKKGFVKRFSETFLSGQDAKTAVTFVLLEVMVPAARDMMADAFTQTMERMVYGESRSTSRKSSYRSDRRDAVTNYTRYSRSNNRYPGRDDRPEREEPRALSRRSRATHEFDEVIMATRPEAEHVLDGMFHLLKEYGKVSVGDFYHAVDITPDFTDEEWGWIELRGSEVRRTSGGYYITFPRPEPLRS